MSHASLSAEQRSFEAFRASAPPDIDVGAIAQQWVAVRGHYPLSGRRLPLPLWARRPFTETGRQAWDVLRGEVGLPDRSQRSLCIYVHIPFCASKCAFCDCYSFALRRHRETHLAGYLGLLHRELRLWSALGSLSQRPVSTVHFGGGNPTFLGARHLTSLVRLLGQSFSAGPQTEWALESTSSELSPAMFACLDSLGFTRLHLGVQSLEDRVRAVIGRREPAARVLDKLEHALALGWVVSVDIILGLPGQTLPGLLHDIRTLAGLGIDGLSLYDLQLSSRNRPFAQRHGFAEEDRTDGYFLFQAASQLLAALGYRKNTFNHFARERDGNLYFTFPQRAEDCLALGTIADGIFGPYHYRHPVYADYARAIRGGGAGLQGGLRRTALEERVHPLEVALLSAQIPSELLTRTLGADSAVRLLGHWRELALVEPAPCPDQYRLTANGSWFVARMIESVHAHASVT